MIHHALLGPESAMRPSVRISLLIAGLIGVAPSIAHAVEFEGRFSAFVAPENPRCTCRFKGEHLPLGSHRCLQTPQGPRNAECVTEQNVTSWRPSDEACPQARLEMPTE